MQRTELPEHAAPLEPGLYVQRKRAEILRNVLNNFRPDELGNFLADCLVARFGRNVGEIVLMNAQDRINRK